MIVYLFLSVKELFLGFSTLEILLYSGQAPCQGRIFPEFTVFIPNNILKENN